MQFVQNRRDLRQMAKTMPGRGYVQVREACHSAGLPEEMETGW